MESGDAVNSRKTQGEEADCLQNDPVSPAAAKRSELIVCCLGTSFANENVISAAAKAAAACGGRLCAVFVEQSSSFRYSDEEKRALENNIRIARSFGASVEIIESDDVAFTLSEFCRINNATQLVLGRSNMKSRFMFWNKSLSEELMALLPDLDLHVIPDYTIHRPTRRQYAKKFRGASAASDLLKTLLMLSIATILCFFFDKMGVDEAVIAPVYLLAVLITAINTESWIWSAMSAVCSILLFNFLFAAPRFSLQYYNRDYFLIFGITLILSLIAGFVGSQLHRTNVQAAQSSWRTKTLLDTTHLLQSAATPGEIVPSLAQMISRVSDKDVLFYSWTNGTLRDLQSFPAAGNELFFKDAVEADRETALKAARQNISTGAGTSTDTDCSWTFFPWSTPHKLYGVLGVRFGHEIQDSMELSMIRSMIAEAALVLENRVQEKEVQEIRLQNQSAQLRSNMLRAISHDLRTPLTSIVGNVQTLPVVMETQDAAQIRQIVTNITKSSVVLSNMVENLLTAAKLDNGTMPLRLSPEMMEDVIGAAVQSLSGSCEDHNLVIEPVEDILMCKMDGALVAQVISNMILNAVQHTPAGTDIYVRAYEKDGQAVVEIADTGPGVRDEIKPRIFDIFFTGAGSVVDSTRSLGLGLYLCKAIVEAHQGSISVADNTPKGAVFSFCLPLMELN